MGVVRKYLSPTEILTRLNQADFALNLGASLTSLLRSLKVTKATYDRWRKLFGDLTPDQAAAITQPSDLQRRADRLESLVREYRELRTLERQAFAIMGRFAIGNVPAAGLKELLAGRLPPAELDTLLTHASGLSLPRRSCARVILCHLCGVPEPLIAEFFGLYVHTVGKAVRCRPGHSS
jgi:hypothetical protein